MPPQGWRELGEAIESGGQRLERLLSAPLRMAASLGGTVQSVGRRIGQADRRLQRQVRGRVRRLRRDIELKGRR